MLDNDVLRVDLAVPNAGRRPATLYVGVLRVYTPPENVLTDVTGVDVEEITIRPGETETATVRMDVREGAREELRAALEAGELVLTGFLGFEVAQSSVRKRLTIRGVGE